MSKRDRQYSDRQTKMLMAQCAQMAYDARSPMTQAQIAEQLEIDPSSVSRLLAKARQSGIIDIRVALPRDEELQLALKRRYGLKDVAVTPVALPKPRKGDPASENGLSRKLGEFAAHVLQEPGGPIRSDMRIGVSCGSTLFETVMALPSGAFNRLKILALTIESMPQFAAQSPSTIAGLLCAKCPEGSKAYAPQFVPRPPNVKPPDSLQQALRGVFAEVVKRAKNLDAALIGIGEINRHRDDLSFTGILKNAGITEDELRKYDVMGEINNRPYDSKGNDCFGELGGLGDTIFAVEIETVKKLARRGEVVAIAGGQGKTRAIDVALRNGFITRLITDTATAERLLALS